MPLRLPPWFESEWDGVREREAERGDMERRGEDRLRRGESALPAVGVCERVRERPRSRDLEAIQSSSQSCVRAKDTIICLIGRLNS